MRYTARKGEGQKRIKDSKGREWEYISKKEYQGLEDEEKRIYGDFRKKDSMDAQYQLLNTDENGAEYSIGIYRYRTSLGYTQAVGGYIPVTVQTDKGEQRGYVRILKASILKPLLIVLTVLAAVAIFLVWYTMNSGEEVPGLDEAAVAYHIEGLSNEDPSRIMIPGMGTIHLAPGETQVDHVLLNPEGNPCYFQFRLVLTDTGETLYESGLVEPGKAILDFNLDRGLETGTYQAEVQISTFSVDDVETQLNNGVVAVTLEVS